MLPNPEIDLSQLYLTLNRDIKVVWSARDTCSSIYLERKCSVISPFFLFRQHFIVYMFTFLLGQLAVVPKQNKIKKNWVNKTASLNWQLFYLVIARCLCLIVVCCFWRAGWIPLRLDLVYVIRRFGKKIIPNWRTGRTMEVFITVMTMFSDWDQIQNGHTTILQTCAIFHSSFA